MNNSFYTVFEYVEHNLIRQLVLKVILTILLSMCSVLMFLDDLHVHLFRLMKRNELYVCLMRGWVCRLQLLLVLGSTVILRSEFHRTHYHILLSQIKRLPQPGGLGPHIYISGTGWPG
jgi:hypothetical protein